MKGKRRLSLEGTSVYPKYHIGLIKVSRKGRDKAQIHEGVILKYFSFYSKRFSVKSMK